MLPDPLLAHFGCGSYYERLGAITSSERGGGGGGVGRAGRLIIVRPVDPPATCHCLPGQDTEPQIASNVCSISVSV